MLIFPRNLCLISQGAETSSCSLNICLLFFQCTQLVSISQIPLQLCVTMWLSSRSCKCRGPQHFSHSIPFWLTGMENDQVNSGSQVLKKEEPLSVWIPEWPCRIVSSNSDLAHAQKTHAQKHMFLENVRNLVPTCYRGKYYSHKYNLVSTVKQKAWASVKGVPSTKQVVGISRARIVFHSPFLP